MTNHRHIGYTTNWWNFEHVSLVLTLRSGEIHKPSYHEISFFVELVKMVQDKLRYTLTIISGRAECLDSKLEAY